MEDKINTSLDDELIDYVSLKKFLNNETEIKKKQIFSEFNERGEHYLDEIDKKKKKKKIKQLKLIPYILKYDGDNFNEEELLSYSFEDVLDIYNEIKKKNRSIIVKFFYFLFNLE